MNQPLHDHAVVRIDQQYQDEIKIKGLVLFLDTTFNPEKNTTIFGHVISTPSNLKNFEDELRVGDKVYYHYLAIHEDMQVDEHDYLIPYSQIFAAIHRGKIRAVNGWTLCQAYFDPTYKTEAIGGKDYRIKESDSGIITSINEEHHHKISRVFSVGTPKKKDPQSLWKEGDLILYHKDCDFANEIEGGEFFAMEQRDIVAKVSDESKIKELL